MEFRKIDSLLEKFRSIIQKSGLEKGAIIDAIKSVSGISVEESVIKISGTVLYVSVMGTKKTLLQLKKDELLTKINESRKRPLTDIR